MSVVTISRELGSFGTYIGKQAAQELGYPFVDKVLIEKVLSEYGMVQFKDLYKSKPGFWARYDRMNIELIDMLNRVILAMAHRNDMVILGRGGFVVLDEYVDVLNVRIQAPFLVRVRRVMEREQVGDFDKIEERVRENDQARRAFVQSFYNSRWDDTKFFNLVIDTGSVFPEMAVDWIAAAAREVEHRTSHGDRSVGLQLTARIEVNPTLQGVVDEVLKQANEVV